MKKKNIVIVVTLFVVLSIVAYMLSKKPAPVETNKKESVVETSKTDKNDKSVKTDKTDKKNETKTSDKKDEVKTDDKKEDVKSETNTSTTTSTENTTSVTPKNDTPKNTETTTSNKTDNVPAPCVPTYTTVNHPEQGHYETRVVKEAEYVPVYDRRAVGGQTGRIYNNLSEFDNQDEDYSYSVKTVQVGTEYHEAITEQVWVVDQPAYTTTESSGC
jgi:hypothetical protein